MRRTTILSIFFIAMLFFGVQVSLVFAQPQGSVTTGTLSPQGSVTVPTGSVTPLINPLNVNTICGLIQKILSFVLSVGTPIAALFLVYAGFLFVTARGKPEALTKAKKNIGYVILGIAIFLGAWLLGQVIANMIKSLSPANAQSAAACS